MTNTTEPQEEEQAVRRIDAQTLGRFAEQVFAACGMPAPDAEILADHLVWADLRGISWLGANKIPEYVARLRAGVTTGTERRSKGHPAATGSASRTPHDRCRAQLRRPLSVNRSGR